MISLHTSYSRGENEIFYQKNLFNIISIILLIIALILAFIVYKKGYFNSLESFRELILSKGAWGPAVFMIIQIIQIVIPIIPGGLTCVAGVVIFGAFGALFIIISQFVLVQYLCFLFPEPLVDP